MSRKIFVVVLMMFLVVLVKGNHLLTAVELQQDDFEDEDERKEAVSKRIAGATVIAAATLGGNVLQGVLDALGSVSRKIALGVANKTPYNWEAIGVHFESGTSDDVLPAVLKPQEAMVYSARKTAGPVATGAVGVLCYYIRSADKSLCVMFSVPFDYTWYSNWWDVKIVSGRKTPNSGLFDDMYDGNPFKGDNSYRQKGLGYGFRMEQGSMSSSGAAKLTCVIKC